MPVELCREPSRSRWTAVITLAVTLFALVPAASDSRPVKETRPAGRQVFEASCAMCHGSDASGMMGMHPSLRGAVERLSWEGVEVTVRKGRQVMPPMPAFEGTLSDQQIDDGDGSMMERRSGIGVVEVLFGVLIVLLVVLAALALAWVARGLRCPARLAAPSAREELNRRCTAGELPRDDYLQRRAGVTGRGPRLGSSGRWVLAPWCWESGSVGRATR